MINTTSSKKISTHDCSFFKSQMAEWSKPLCKVLQIAQWVTVTSPLGRTFLATFFVALNANKTDLEIYFF